MNAPGCKLCGKRHWSNDGCEVGLPSHNSAQAAQGVVQKHFVPAVDLVEKKSEVLENTGYDLKQRNIGLESLVDRLEAEIIVLRAKLAAVPVNVSTENPQGEGKEERKRRLKREQQKRYREKKRLEKQNEHTSKDSGGKNQAA